MTEIKRDIVRDLMRVAYAWADEPVCPVSGRSGALEMALRAALAKVEQGEPVGHWTGFMVQWTGKEPPMNTPLFTHPVRPMSGEPVLGTKTWMEGGVVMTQNLTASDIYKPVPMTEDEFITAIEASGIEVENVDAAFAIKRIVELFHDIKGATE